MAYTTIDKPTDYFNTVLYTGNATTPTNITGVGFQPDWVWIKNRDNAEVHILADVVRGANKLLESNTSDAELSDTNYIKGFASDGFQIGSEGAVNGNNQGHVAWNWLAGTAFSNDASATGVGTLDSSGSVNATAGFSIISFTGTETSNQSIAHGLSSTPEFIISKSRDVVDNWMVFHESFSAQDYISLNLTSAKASSANVWTSLPSSTVINIGDNAGVNDNGAMIMYAFYSVKGFSKFGSYTGNGNADGTFIYTGFKPAFIIAKRTDTTAVWGMYDNKRTNSFNPQNGGLAPDLSVAEFTDVDIDFISNGFKIRDTDATINASGGSYIYMAFAESPLVTSTGIPTTAR
jgi:hypothetical protein